MFVDISTSGYGYNSFFDKFAGLENSKVIYFGADINHSTYVHHIEHMLGVSYVYNKAYFEPTVKVNDVVINKPFFNSVKYLGKNIEPNYAILEKTLIKKDKIKIAYINDFKLMVIDVQDLIDEVYEILQVNQCALLKENFYVTE